jgi:hypothetical protein
VREGSGLRALSIVDKWVKVREGSGLRALSIVDKWVKVREGSGLRALSIVDTVVQLSVNAKLLTTQVQEGLPKKTTFPVKVCKDGESV